MRSLTLIALTVFMTFCFATAARADSEGYIGVMIKKADDGIEIIGVFADAPADKAGLKKGDVIKKLDGNEVDTLPLDVFIKKIVASEPGSEIKLVISRDGKEVEIKVKVGKKGE